VHDSAITNETDDRLVTPSGIVAEMIAMMIWMNRLAPNVAANDDTATVAPTKLANSTKLPQEIEVQNRELGPGLIKTWE
jgi:hypothetical protein